MPTVSDKKKFRVKFLTGTRYVRRVLPPATPPQAVITRAEVDALPKGMSFESMDLIVKRRASRTSKLKARR